MVDGVGKMGEMVLCSSPRPSPSATFSSPVIRYSNMPTEMARRSLDSTSVATASAPFKHIVPVGVVVTTMSIGRRVVIESFCAVQLIEIFRLSQQRQILLNISFRWVLL